MEKIIINEQEFEALLMRLNEPPKELANLKKLLTQEVKLR